MRSEVKTFVNKLDRRNFTNNTQRVLYTLLRAAVDNKGVSKFKSLGTGWLSVKDLRVPSAASRVRDLRLNKFGGFVVACLSAVEVGLPGDANTFYYSVDTRDLTVSRLRKVFG